MLDGGGEVARVEVGDLRLDRFRLDGRRSFRAESCTGRAWACSVAEHLLSKEPISAWSFWFCSRTAP